MNEIEPPLTQDEERDMESFFKNPERCRQKYEEAWALGARAWRLFKVAKKERSGLLLELAKLDPEWPTR